MKKLNILLDNPDGWLPDYVNFDPMAKVGEKTILTDITNLDEYIDDSECSEIRAVNILSYFDAGKIDLMLQAWVKKLAHGGELVIADIDVIQVFKAFGRAEINLGTMSELLYGKQVRKWDLRKICLTMSEVADALMAKGMIISEKRFENLNFYIKAVRK